MDAFLELSDVSVPKHHKSFYIPSQKVRGLIKNKFYAMKSGSLDEIIPG